MLNTTYVPGYMRLIYVLLIRSAECDSLADGEHRRLREDGKECECKDGWGGINCNGESMTSYAHKLDTNLCLVCKSDNACKAFPLRGGDPSSSFDGGDEDEDEIAGMTCYKGGETVFNNHQMCDVTSKPHAPIQT